MSSLENRLKNCKYIEDAHVEGKNIWFTSTEKINYEKLKSDFGNDYNFIPVNNLDSENWKESAAPSSEQIKSIEKAFSEASINETVLTLNWKDNTPGFDTSGLHQIGKEISRIQILDKPAFIDGGTIRHQEELDLNLIDLLERRKESNQTLLYIKSDGTEIRETYGELYHNVAHMAWIMKKQGIRKGDQLIFQLEDRRNFIHCFWSAMVIGAAVVPLEVLNDYQEENVNTEKLHRISGFFDSVKIVTEGKSAKALQNFAERHGLDCPVISMDELRVYEDKILKEHGFTSEEECIYLFTSGSTGIPKGVGLCQHNILARTLGEIQMYQLDNTCIDFNWMTLTHAAGLIWSHIRDVYLDSFQVQAETEWVLQDPIRLPASLDRFQATTSWAPNFAYALVGEAMDAERDYGWDLSHATNLYSGGETNVSRSLRNFLKHMKKYGMPDDGLIPSFGMTETSSSITYYNGFNLSDWKDEDTLIPVGQPICGIQARVCDEKGKVLRMGETGYVQIRGETLLKEYYKNSEANAKSFSKDGWLITGDLGHILQKDLVLSGRSKDIIIVNGLNYNVEDFEELVDKIDDVKSGYTAVITSSKQGQEETILFFTPMDETLFQEEKQMELKAVIKEVARVLQIKSFVALDHIIPITEDDFPRSNIGKKQRKTLKDDYQAGCYKKLLDQLEEVQDPYAFQSQSLEKDITDKVHSIKNIELLNFSDEWKTRLEEKIVPWESGNKGYDTSIYIDGTFLNDVFQGDMPDEKTLKAAFLKIKGLLSSWLKKKGVLYIPLNEKKESFPLWSSILSPLLKSISLENEDFSYKLIVMENPDAASLLDEMYSIDHYKEVYYKNGKRYVPGFKTIQHSCSSENQSEMFQEKLVVVTGAIGGVGQLLCRYLSKWKDVTVLALGRREEEKIAESIKLLRDEGVDLIYQQADVTDFDSVKKACQKGKEISGKTIGAIFHLAVYNPHIDEAPVEDLLKKDFAEAFLRSTLIKYSGIKHLEILRKEENAILYLFSSLTGFFGWEKLASYACANRLAESFCNLQGENTRFIEFGAWSGIGINHVDSKEKMQDNMNNYDSHKYSWLSGFGEKDGMELVDAILSWKGKQAYVGMERNDSRVVSMIADSYHITGQLILSDSKDLEEIYPVINQFCPNLSGKMSYRVAKPIILDGDEEETLKNLKVSLSQIWEERLNCTDLSMDDNLFDLGGSSLTIFGIKNDIQERLQVDIAPVDIMTYATVQDLAVHIIQRQKEAFGSESKKTDRLRKQDLRKKRLQATAKRKDKAHELCR